MKCVIQRVKEAKVVVESKVVSSINKGILVLLAIEKGDTKILLDKLADKLVNLRIFNDQKNKMNLSIQEINGEFLVVSQFTLAGSLKKGRRPSFEKAESPAKAKMLYEYFCNHLSKFNLPVKTGIFGALMEVHLVNDGPVTFIIEKE